LYIKDLYTYLVKGGASGHMAHHYDYTEFTLRDLKGKLTKLTGVFAPLNQVLGLQYK
jgi:hypothetical protein